MKFRDYLNEDFTQDITMAIFKFLKKKGKKANYYPEEFEATEKFDFKFEGNKFIIHYNDKDFNSAVFHFEWA